MTTKAWRIVEAAAETAWPFWNRHNAVRLNNQRKVLAAFQKARVSSDSFGEATGYGYDDPGREALETVFAGTFGTDAALVRPQIVSGTHAIALCLGLLTSGDEVISLSGSPYDSLHQVIGSAGCSKRSLKAQGVRYREVPLADHGGLDLQACSEAITSSTTMVLLQRSRGYSWRRALTIAELEAAIDVVRRKRRDVIVFVDNCYGEFVEPLEPSNVGADLIAGSLIKNPGGSLAPAGGYICGREELVSEIAEILTAPGLGTHLGSTFGLARLLLQGFFQAPLIVGEALAGAVLAAEVFSRCGFAVSPAASAERSDIIQAVQFRDRRTLLRCLRALHRSAPVDAHYTPEPAALPGYDDPIIMAGGTFVQGGSVELSADAPLREPFIGYIQGGISRDHMALALETVVSEIGLFSEC